MYDVQGRMLMSRDFATPEDARIVQLQAGRLSKNSVALIRMDSRKVR
jgi:hypothetical protein